MEFTPCVDLEIVNCDYADLKKSKEEIEQKNKDIKKNNKRLKRAEVVLIVIWSLVMMAITAFAMYYAWSALCVGLENNAFFSEHEEIKPIWVKCVIEAIVFLLGVAIYRVILSSVLSSIKKQIGTASPLNEQMLFASATEGNSIGNLQFSRIHYPTPYVRQATAFTFDAVVPSETEYYHFAANPSKWSAILIPGIFKTVIDVENLLVFIPYFEDGETHSIESAYVREKRYRIDLEKRLRELDDLTPEKVQTLQKACETNARLEKELINVTTRLEKAQQEKEDTQIALDQASTLYCEEVEKNRGWDAVLQQKEEKFQAEKTSLMHQLENAADAQHKAEEQCKTLNESNSKKDEQIRVLLAEKEASTNAVAEAGRERDEAIKKAKDEFDKKAKLVEASFQNQLKEKEMALLEADALHKKQLREREESFEATISDYRASLSETNRLLEDTRNERDAHLATINQLEHNAQADHAYHKNLETEYSKIKTEMLVLTEQLNEYHDKEKTWNNSKTIIDSQKQEISALNERCDTLNNQKETLEKQLLDMRDAVTARDVVEAKAKDLSETNESLEKKVQSLEQSVGDLRSRNKKLSQDLDVSVHKTKEMEAKIEELTDKNAKEASINERTRADLLALQKKHTEAQNYITSLESKLQNAYNETEAAKKEAQAAQEASKRSAGDAAKRDAEASDFRRLMKEREEQMRKAREDAMAAKNQTPHN